MSDFKREERYIVVKVKDMDNITEDALRKFLFEREIQTVGCVVTEEDWPNYEHVWQTIEQVANGTFDPDEITRLQAENEAMRARVAELEHLIRFAQVDSGVCMCGDDVESHNQASGHSPVDIWDHAAEKALEGTSEAWLLRKQAEAVERCHINTCLAIGKDAVRNHLFCEAQRLRQQADEAERAGGEK